MKFYELAEQYNTVRAMLDSGATFTEDAQDCDYEQALRDTLDGIGGELEDKAADIAVLVKEMNAEAAALKEEEYNLAERRRAKENRVKWLTQYLTDNMQAAGLAKVDKPRATLSFRKSKGVKIDDEEGFILWAEQAGQDRFLNVKTTVNKTAIRDALKAGDELPGAVIEERQSLQIK